jgi:putative DNA methylase
LKPPLSGPRGPTDEDLRQALIKFIADFANWDAAADPVYLEAARALVKAAHGDEPPLVVDPFAGGGSIPLEALRLGCDAFASDLNPVACLILKVLLEDIPRHGSALAEELRKVGAEVKAAAEKELAESYPPDPDGARPIAYLWARTVRREAPNCGAEIPLARSFWLAKKEVWGRKAGKRVKVRGRQALRYSIVRTRGRPPEIVFELFEPRTDSAVPRGTVSRAKATCPVCNIVLPPERVRAQLGAQKGGADVAFDRNGARTGGARLLAVVTLEDEERGRRYRLPTHADYGALRKAVKELDKHASQLHDGLSLVPDEPLPKIGTLGFRVQRYGMLQWGDLFTARQKLALVEVAQRMRQESGKSVSHAAAAVVSRCADYWSSGVMWAEEGEFVAHTFGRQALPIVWDFAEAAPWAKASGNFSGAVDWVAGVIETNAAHGRAQVQLTDACKSPLGTDAACIWFTDPPYYDAVPYADLSDFFFVWLKRTLPEHPLLRDPFDPANTLTPKDREVVQDETKKFEGRPKDRAFFEEMMARAFAEGARVLRDDGVGSVVFAHKTTEGWEALLGGMIRGGWVITASWPITTERPGRLRAQESAALAASVHLVARPRDAQAPVGDWGDVVRALPARISEWMDRLSAEGIRGADLVFACIGPALELYSKYRAVETAEGEIVALAASPDARSEPARRGYLSYVWEAVGRAALARVLGPVGGNGGVLEEDARLTALFLWTAQSTAPTNNGGDPGEEGESDDDDDEAGGGSRKKGLTLIYDVARRFAQPLGIHLDQWEGRIIDTDKGVVRLLPVRERAAQLFGEAGASVVARRIETAAKASTGAAQGTLFPELAQPAGGQVGQGQRGGRRTPVAGSEDVQARRDATTLDRVHAAMLFQDGGATSALRSLLQAEVERGPDFLRLANALSALYPADSEEKRLLDAMLLAVPR